MMFFLALYVAVVTGDYGKYGCAAIEYHKAVNDVVFPLWRIHGCMSAGYFVAISGDIAAVLGFVVVDFPLTVGGDHRVYTFNTSNNDAFLEMFIGFTNRRDTVQRTYACRTEVYSWIETRKFRMMNTTDFRGTLKDGFDLFLRKMDYTHQLDTE